MASAVLHNCKNTQLIASRPPCLPGCTEEGDAFLKSICCCGSLVTCTPTASGSVAVREIAVSRLVLCTSSNRPPLWCINVPGSNLTLRQEPRSAVPTVKLNTTVGEVRSMAYRQTSHRYHFRIATKTAGRFSAMISLLLEQHTGWVTWSVLASTQLEPTQQQTRMYSSCWLDIGSW